jgi:hypothetical protein
VIKNEAFVHRWYAEKLGRSIDPYLYREHALSTWPTPASADIGQGPDVTWMVLADPEGNEFCLL